MAKAIRSLVPGCLYHLTHRCHDGDYLLRFARDRDVYRELLRKYSNVYRVPVLGYCLTSNHVHLLVEFGRDGGVSEFMDALQGDFAQKYNMRKDRSGSFWNGRYHATAVESSRHLWDCLRYIDLNMVRAGVVKHPSEWRWCSYPELSGARKRYRVVNAQSFKHRFEQDPQDPGFIDFYSRFIQEGIDADNRREPAWSESLAVGSRGFVKQISAEIRNRIRFDISNSTSNNERWVLKENGPLYR